MTRYVVFDGTAYPIVGRQTEADCVVIESGEAFFVGQTPPRYAKLDRDTYGSDWIVVDATDERHALDQAEAFDDGLHPAQTEMDLFAAAYRAGALGL
jgi:hypothetical protein